jgi:hypothetical protein
VAVSVTHTTADLTEARRVPDRLLAGGTEVMAFGPTFWSEGFGMLKDKFGTHRMVMGRTSRWAEPPRPCRPLPFPALFCMRQGSAGE